jgi:uncharacterized membrane protein HdeD (DUF308 family)
MEMSKELTRDSWLFILRGILAIAVGILAFVFPSPTLAALIIVFGVYAVFNGVVSVAAGLGAYARPNWWLVAGGVAAIAIGVYAFFQPGTTAEALVVVVGVFAIVTGVAELAAAATVGSIVGHRFLLTLSGIVALAFGLLLIMSPTDGILSVLWLIGFYAIFAGVMYIAMGWSLRDVADTAKTVESGGTATGGTAASA